MPTEIGVQSYTYRKFPVRRAIDEAKAAGCQAIELWPGHLPPDTAEAEVEAVCAHARRQGQRICGYGVIGLSGEAPDAQVRFARRLGCDYVSVDVRPQDRERQAAAAALAAQLGLTLGIHNHGPRHHYSTVDTVLAVVRDLPPNFGACVDTGHFLRADQDPVAAIRALGPRVHAVHLKDFLDEHTEVLPGSGRLDLPAAVRALRDVGFRTAYVLEYEADENDPTPAVSRAVAAVAAAMGA